MPASGDKPKPRSTFAAASPAGEVVLTAGAFCAAAGREHAAASVSTAALEGAADATDDNDPARPVYTVGEEIANAVTHGIGALLASAGLALLVTKVAYTGGDAVALLSAIVFGVSLILEYSASALYHAVSWAPAKRVLRILDHSCIYLLIAGSYTPFLLGPLLERGGIPMFIVVWVMALLGIGLELVCRQRQPRWMTVAIYLVMGWLVVFNLPALVASVEPACLALTAAGGVCYTVGTGFYLMKRVRYMHSVWHLWVLAGSVCQYLAVILFIM